MNSPNLTDEESKDIQLQKELEGIFCPNARILRDKKYGDHLGSAKFSHYTSAEAALKIINTKTLWMRNTNCMSDYREVEHGFDLLNTFFNNGKNKDRFIKTLDLVFENIGLEAIDLFNKWLPYIRTNTYISALSDHRDEENQHGRLSLWRGFGGNLSRVAFVFNIPAIGTVAPGFNVRFTPVLYTKATDVIDEIEKVISNVNEEIEFLKTVDRSVVLAHIFNMFLSGVSCTKHEGFREEEEWRAVYIPKMYPSFAAEAETVCVSGIPQIVQTLILDKDKIPDIGNLDFASIFDRLIIGPSLDIVAQQQAFISALNKAGVQDAEDRVFYSGIPIRI